MDGGRFERLVRELLTELEEDPSRPGLARTPERFREVLSRFELRPGPPVLAGRDLRPEHPGQMVLVRDLGFLSLCEHHLLPFFGTCQIGCIPREHPCDPQWCMEVVTFFAHRFQLQERLTEQIADALYAELAPEGVGVAIDGQHMCMMMRGVQKQNSHIQTSSLRGAFLEPAVHGTFAAMLRRRRIGVPLRRR